MKSWVRYGILWIIGWKLDDNHYILFDLHMMIRKNLDTPMYIKQPKLNRDNLSPCGLVLTVDCISKGNQLVTSNLKLIYILSLSLSLSLSDGVCILRKSLDQNFQIACYLNLLIKSCSRSIFVYIEPLKSIILLRN